MARCVARQRHTQCKVNQLPSQAGLRQVCRPRNGCCRPAVNLEGRRGAIPRQDWAAVELSAWRQDRCWWQVVCACPAAAALSPDEIALLDRVDSCHNFGARTSCQIHPQKQMGTAKRVPPPSSGTVCVRAKCGAEANVTHRKSADACLSLLATPHLNFG